MKNKLRTLSEAREIAKKEFGCDKVTQDRTWEGAYQNAPHLYLTVTFCTGRGLNKKCVTIVTHDCQ